MFAGMYVVLGAKPVRPPKRPQQPCWYVTQQRQRNGIEVPKSPSAFRGGGGGVERRATQLLQGLLVLPTSATLCRRSQTSTVEAKPFGSYALAQLHGKPPPYGGCHLASLSYLSPKGSGKSWQQQLKSCMEQGDDSEY